MAYKTYIKGYKLDHEAIEEKFDYDSAVRIISTELVTNYREQFLYADLTLEENDIFLVIVVDHDDDLDALKAREMPDCPDILLPIIRWNMCIPGTWKSKSAGK